MTLDTNRPIAARTSPPMKRLLPCGAASGTPNVGSYGTHPIPG